MLKAGSEFEIFRGAGRATKRGSAVQGSGQRRMALEASDRGALCKRLWLRLAFWSTSELDGINSAIAAGDGLNAAILTTGS